MKTLKVAVIAIVATLAASAQAKDTCFTFDNGDPAALTLYKVKVVNVHKGQSVHLMGVAVMPNNPQASPLTVEGAALGLTEGHINFYLTAIKQDGKPMSEPVYVQLANQPSYSGTNSPGLSHVPCDNFPPLQNL